MANGTEAELRRRRVAAIGAYLYDRPDLAASYARARRVIRAFRRPAFYEVATRCNLLCEGCYYFEGGQTGAPETEDLAAWRAFFEAEAARGVSMAYFIGAEPAMEPERLQAANGLFPHANVGTNGTIKIDPEIDMRISISVWSGDVEEDARLRGAGVFGKALKNYAGDPRALVVYTLSRWNLAGARRAAQLCREHGLPMTFNMYSPTSAYLSKLAAREANDRRYFRISSAEDNACFDEETLAEARRVVAELMTDFPETIVYSHAYNDWSTAPGPRYALDEDGVATDCHSRIKEPLRYHTADLKSVEVKCCTFDIDCSQCRIYSGGWSSKFEPRPDDLADIAAFERWLDMVDTAGRIFVLEPRERAGMPVAAE